MRPHKTPCIKPYLCKCHYCWWWFSSLDISVIHNMYVYGYGRAMSIVYDFFAYIPHTHLLHTRTSHTHAGDIFIGAFTGHFSKLGYYLMVGRTMKLLPFVSLDYSLACDTTDVCDEAKRCV